MTDVLRRNFEQSADVVETAVGDETIILQLASGTYFGLDMIGTRIWELIKLGNKPTEVCQILADEFAVDIAAVQKDAREFIGELLAKGILVDV